MYRVFARDHGRAVPGFARVGDRHHVGAGLARASVIATHVGAGFRARR
jgi:hypothetical protein